MGRKCAQTHRKVPAENSKRIPVRQYVRVSSPSVPPPMMWTKRKVTKAPTGAARLNTNKCALAARLEMPCFRRTDVRPKDAGALWTMMARKMMKLRPVSELDAPRAIPSAAAWITRPVVVAKLWLLLGTLPALRSPPSREGEEFRRSPDPKLSKEM